MLGGQSLQCAHCPKTYKNKDSLRAHQKSCKQRPDRVEQEQEKQREQKERRKEQYQAYNAKRQGT